MIIDTICIGCEHTVHVNDLGLCEDCYAKLDRDLIRARDWEYSAIAFSISEEDLEALREKVIRDYGIANELLESLEIQKLRRKNKRSKSRATQRKREITAQAIHEYGTDEVLQATLDFLRDQGDEWVNFSTVSQHLYERFYKLKPKHLGQASKKYKSLLKLLQDYPDMFVIKDGKEKRGAYWIHLA
jgi:hypothetical protein